MSILDCARICTGTFALYATLVSATDAPDLSRSTMAACAALSFKEVSFISSEAEYLHKRELLSSSRAGHEAVMQDSGGTNEHIQANNNSKLLLVVILANPAR